MILSEVESSDQQQQHEGTEGRVIVPNIVLIIFKMFIFIIF